MDRLTFDRLYQEGLFVKGANPKLFTAAITKNTPHLLWPYIGNSINRVIQDVRIDPSSPEGVLYAKKELSLNAKEFIHLIRISIPLLINDLVRLISNPKIQHNYHYLVIVWEHLETSKRWKVMAFYNSIDISRTPPVKIKFFLTLDEMLKFVDEQLVITDEVNSFDEVVISSEREFNISGVKLFSETELSFLRLIQANLAPLQELEEMWESLHHEGSILAQNTFVFSAVPVTAGSIFTVIGDNLYIMVIQRVTLPSGKEIYYSEYLHYFEKEVGLLVLSCFFFDRNEWEYLDS